MENKIRSIYCLNTKCKHYFEDWCMKMFEDNTVNISKDGLCEDYEYGAHIGYCEEERLKNEQETE